MKNYVFVVLLLATSFCGWSQENEPEKIVGLDKSRLFIGGNFGLNFGNYTLVNVSPQIGYRFNDYFAAGTGVNFIYSSLKTNYNNSTSTKINQGVAGVNVFGRVYPIKQVLLQVQPELNYTWGKFKDSGPGYEDSYKLENKFVPSLLLGAGAALPTGPGAFMLMAQYDVLQDARTPYGDKVFFSFGYNIGF